MEIKILYEDDEIVVCIKPAELLSEQTDDPNESLAAQIAEKNNGYVGVVHRLDRGVGGVMVYAKTPAAAAALSRSVQSHEVQKEYLAVVHGTPSPACGEMRDLLFHDRRLNKSFAVSRTRAGVKEALLDYTTLSHHLSDRCDALSLMRIRLHTGRTHQIRVQFSSRGYPLLGDGKYGARGDRCPIALFSALLSFPHPKTRKPMRFEALPVGVAAFEAAALTSGEA